MKELQYILGHYNIYMTRQLYGEATKLSLSKKIKHSSDLDTASPPLI